MRNKTPLFGFVNKNCTRMMLSVLSLVVTLHSGAEGLPFPYHTDFKEKPWWEGNMDDKGLGWCLMSNTSDKPWHWYFSSGYFGSENSSYEHSSNDPELRQPCRLVSPAIHLEAGTHHISFYYSGTWTRLVLSLEDLAGRVALGSDSLVLNIESKKENRNAGCAVSVANEGDYRIVLSATAILGISPATSKALPPSPHHQRQVRPTIPNNWIEIYSFSADDGEDLCLEGIGFTEQTGEGLGTSDVVARIANNGMSPMSYFQVAYWLEGSPETTFRETIAGPLLPGDTLVHTFSQVADISNPGIRYRLEGQLSAAGDADSLNNTAKSTYLYHDGVRPLPYEHDFSDDHFNSRWRLDGKQWHFAKNGKGDTGLANDYRPWLEHFASWNGTRSDWAYSEAFHLPVGEYELSFLHHTGLSTGTQSYEVTLGSGCTPEAMDNVLARYEGIRMLAPSDVKHVSRFHVESEGDYYLGIHNYGEQDNYAYIGDISVHAVEAGTPLPFESDFTRGTDGWTIYEQQKMCFPEWKMEDGAMVVRRNSITLFFYEGMLVAPLLRVPPGGAVVEVEYDIEATGDLSLCLYEGEWNDPARMRLVATGSKDAHLLRAEMRADDGIGDRYFAIRGSKKTTEDQEHFDIDKEFYTIRVHSVKVTPLQSAIADVVTAPASKAIYNLSGLEVQQPIPGHVYLQGGRKFVAK